MKVLFRADGNESIGLGHVIRSLALAEMLKENFDCVFAIRNPSDSLLKTISEVCSEIIILPHSDNYEELDPFLNGTEIVVLDGYKFNTQYQRHIKGKGCRLVCIDDIHAYHFVADVVINHGTTDASVYSKEPYTKMLLGPSFSLLRKAFLEQPGKQSMQTLGNSVLLCFGGSDELNLTCVYLKKILLQKNVTAIHVVVGSAFQHHRELEDLAKRHRDFVSIHCNISPKKLANTIRSCRVAIVSSSTIALECASVGVSLITGFYVNNQLDIDFLMRESAMALSLGDLTKSSDSDLTESLHKALMHSNYEKFISNQRNYFDGRAVDRLLTEFNGLANYVVK